MKSQHLDVDENVLIGHNQWAEPVRVGLQSYMRFNRRMDLQLRRLVARWAHAAAPQSKCLSRGDFENRPERRWRT